MPLAHDANDDPVQALHAPRSQVIAVNSLTSVLSLTFGDGVVAIELQPNTDTRLHWGNHADNSPGTFDVYLKAGNYYVYATREYTKVGLMAANGAADGVVILTELS